VTSWSIFPATNGPSAATSLSGSYVAGMMWEVTQSALWLYGYRAWCCNTGQLTTPVRCALWTPRSSTGGDGALIPGSAALTGTLVPGTWNNAMLAAPVPIAIGTPYIAAIAYDGNFPFTISQFGPAEPFASGIANGPLIAYSDSASGATVNATPYTLPQGSFTQANSDPALAMPSLGNSSFNSWADVIISDVPPAGYSGPYELWPNKYDASPATGIDTNLPFTLANQVGLARKCTVSWLKFFSPAGAAGLPTSCTVYSVASQLAVITNAAPSWVQLDGVTPAVAGGGWCKAAMTGTLPAGQYKAAVYNANGATAPGWSPREYGYWLTGAGSAGVSWGPVSSPAQGSAASAYVWQSGAGSTPPFTSGGQQEPQNGTFFQPPSGASTGYPYLGVDFNKSIGAPANAIAENFWTDLIVTPVPVKGGAAYDHHHREYRR
jgi:hypothetical protein